MEGNNSNIKIVFHENTKLDNVLTVNFLGAKHSIDGLTRACKFVCLIFFCFVAFKNCFFSF